MVNVRIYFDLYGNMGIRLSVCSYFIERIRVSVNSVLIITYRALSVGLLNGGFGGLFWVFIGTVVCYSTIVASLAEMESMAPTSGGQYHWVSEFAPEEYQKFFSYAAGKIPYAYTYYFC